MQKVLGVALVVSIGCGGGGDDVADAMPPPDVFYPPGCIQPSQRALHTVTVSGAVRDWITDDPVAGATVEVSTAWDVQGNFPNTPSLMCPPIISLTTNANGQFGPALIEIGSTSEPPVTIFMVSGGGRAPTLSDARVGGCTLGVVDCGNQGHIMRVPSEALGSAWRTELAAGGMTSAEQRGISLFLFYELAGPSSGVEALEGTLTVRPLVLGTEVRYLAADRATLAPATQPTTLDPGIAVVGVPGGTAGLALGGVTSPARRCRGSTAPW